MKKYALIVAGGKGLRMGADLPKQFLELAGLPVLMHTIKAFRQVEDIHINLVLPLDHMEYWATLCKFHQFSIPHQLIEGGASRFQSVKNGLAGIPKDALVAIHDGVRPLVSTQVINDGFLTATEKGNAIAVVPLKDSLRKQEFEKNFAVNRANYFLVQTPQTFHSNSIQEAYEAAADDNFTDDASVLEAQNKTIHLIPGDYKNIKITTPEDLLIAEAFLRN